MRAFTFKTTDFLISMASILLKQALAMCEFLATYPETVQNKAVWDFGCGKKQLFATTTNWRDCFAQ